jgi:hypothetical protein
MDLYQVRPSQFIRVQHSLNTRELLLGKIKQEMPDELIKELCKHISQDLQVGIFILFRCFFFCSNLMVIYHFFLYVCRLL